MNGSWWSPRFIFDAQVLVCALGFRVEHAASGATVGTVGCSPEESDGSDATWSHVVTGALGVPQLPSLATDGTIGDRARCSLNFRDEYYGLIPAVSDDGSGPPLVTSGLIDPGRCHWGERPVRFAKRDFAAPRVDVARLDAPMRAWARRKLVPKVLVANQTRIVEAVADPGGAWLPGVPVSSLVPNADATVWELAAVLTSPVAAAAAWHAAAGTGLSARAIRLGPAALASLPWPAGDIAPATQLLRDGDVLGCGRSVSAAYSCGDDQLYEWWSGLVNGATEGRRGSSTAPSRASRRPSTARPNQPAR
jgi:hypothetical protein